MQRSNCRVPSWLLEDTWATKWLTQRSTEDLLLSSICPLTKVRHLSLRGEPAWAAHSGAAVSYARLIPESCAHTLVKSSFSICRCFFFFFFSALFRRYLIVTAPLGLRPFLLSYFSSTLSAKPWRPLCAGSCSCGDSRDFGLRTLTTTTRRRGLPPGGGTHSCRPMSYRKMASVSWFIHVARWLVDAWCSGCRMLDMVCFGRLSVSFLSTAQPLWSLFPKCFPLFNQVWVAVLLQRVTSGKYDQYIHNLHRFHEPPLPPLPKAAARDPFQRFYLTFSNCSTLFLENLVAHHPFQQSVNHLWPLRINSSLMNWIAL